MEHPKLKFFQYSKELNEKHHDFLIKNKFHFRGNLNSFSLVSLQKETAEKGVSNLKDKEKAENILFKPINLEKPKRKTPEKVLQAWIILEAIKNSGKLPIADDLTFITSELVFKNQPKFKLEKAKRDIRNDILAIDEKNNLCIIELKSSRSNEVKIQTREFEKVVKQETDFFLKLVEMLTGKKWNGNSRKIAVWPNAKGSAKVNEYSEVEVLNYTDCTEHNKGFIFE
jgi:hypothetical protein